MSRRTHYTSAELWTKLRNRFPRVSARTFAQIQESENILYTHAGVDVLIRVSEYQRFVTAIRKAKLIEQNGFLVLPDSLGRS